MARVRIYDLEDPTDDVCDAYAILDKPGWCGPVRLLLSDLLRSCGAGISVGNHYGGQVVLPVPQVLSSSPEDLSLDRDVLDQPEYVDSHVAQHPFVNALDNGRYRIVAGARLSAPATLEVYDLGGSTVASATGSSFLRAESWIDVTGGGDAFTIRIVGGSGLTVYDAFLLLERLPIDPAIPPATRPFKTLLSSAPFTGNVAATETSLLLFTIPGGTGSIDGDRLKCLFSGRLLGDPGDIATLRVYLNGSLRITSTVTQAGAFSQDWEIVTSWLRGDATSAWGSQVAAGNIVEVGALGDIAYIWSGDVDVEITVEMTSLSGSDDLCKLWTASVELKPV